MFFRFFFCFLVVCFCVSPSVAEVNVKIHEAEKAVFAFFKLASHVPEFEKWSESFTPDEPMGDNDLRTFHEQQKLRLQWGFGTYEEHKDFLKLRTPVTVELLERDGKKALVTTLDNYSDSELVYFPYVYTDQTIGLVVNSLRRKNKVPLDDVHYAQILKSLGGQTKASVSLRLKVRPLDADMSEPLIVDNRNVWVLEGDVAYMAYEVKDAAGQYQRFITYNAPWYLSDSEKELMDILEE